MGKAGTTGGNELTAVVITVSDRCARGETEDLSGPAVALMLREAGMEVVGSRVVADERAELAGEIEKAAASARLVVTTGGTGLAPRDVTPEATRDVLDCEVPGIGELMRLESYKVTSRAALSRATAGLVGASLVINLPGSVKAARENLAAVLAVIPHAVELAGGRVSDCGR